MAVRTLINGFPRIGEHRELKKVLEDYWARKVPFDRVEDTARALRKKHWQVQKDAGIDLVSSNDFSLYDNMLDTIVMLNAVPKRFDGIADKNERYFAMARGNGRAAAMEMTKWFNLSRVNSPPLWGVKLGVRGICSPAYAKISRKNLQYPAA
ncbi:MAG: hypothetical protein LBK74_09925, partial [Treponema sp.]|nr:hypothetical protein [Treponema sp.]